ncbi:MAG: hypothetical protein KDI80_17065, partial [Xanthomonadales bacterium]|nr:hypothetical protein [Xanthomonadales bacterium]
NRLARYRLDSSALDQAIECARRSNSLAGGDDALVRSNWELLATAYERRGDVAAARDARIEAERFRG